MYLCARCMYVINNSRFHSPAPQYLSKKCLLVKAPPSKRRLHVKSNQCARIEQLGFL
jgi:hypothetical protein